MDEAMRGNLLFLLSILALILFFAYLGQRDKKRRRLSLRRKLKEDFGRPADKKMPPERFLLVPRYFEKHPEPSQIDDITWNDLDMDALYARMDHTRCASGEEYLYYLLRTPALRKEELKLREEMLSCFAGGSREAERLDLEEILTGLGHTGKYSLYDFLDALESLEEGRPLRHLLYPAMIAAALCAMAVYPQAILLLMAACCASILTYFRQKRRIEPYLVSFRYILRLMQTAGELGKKLPDPFGPEKELLLKNVKDTAIFRRGAFLLGSGSGAGGSFADLVLDYLRILLHLDLFQFDRMLSALRVRREAVDALITGIGAVDAALAVTSFRESLPVYCLPEFTEDRGFDAGGLYHPLLDHPVANSVRTCRPVLLTGSNASGKSTFLKAAALGALLAQTVGTVPASSYRAPLCRIYSSMALRDSLGSGESYFIVEIRSLSRILTAAGNGDRTPVLCCIDEVLRGTNTTERIAASCEILSALARAEVLCFAATHDLELTALLKDVYDNYHFTEELEEGDVRFSYLLTEGPATSRNAIRLLDMLGYDRGIVERASERAARFEETGKWLTE